MAAGLKDVAALAGVSIKSVSNVINDRPYVSSEMRARVQKAVDELGYRPNLQARGLRTGRSGVIALGVPRLDEAYFAEVAGQVIDVAEQVGLTVLVEQTNGVRERELEVLSGIRPGVVDGVILSPLGLTTSDLERASIRNPVVLLGEQVSDSGLDHLRIDNVQAAHQITHLLLASGRRRIAVVGARSDQHAEAARLRVAGYCLAHRHEGHPYDERLFVPVASFRRGDGARAVYALVESGASFDAVFCCNDQLALGALSALRQHGLAVPDDVAVVGFDDIEECAFSYPALTTVAPDKRELAARAVHTLVARLNGHDQVPSPHIPFAVVQRDSSGWRC